MESAKPPISEVSGPSSPPRTPRNRRDFGGRKGNHGFGGPGLSMSNTSRPQSAGSRRSTTHAPSITSQAFFRPMSSQRLQAQRGSRPFTGASEDIPDVPRLSTSTANRPSMESSSAITNPKGAMPPPSRGTTDTEQRLPDRVYHNSSPTGADTLRTGDSSRPLNDSFSSPQNAPDPQERPIRTPKTPQSYESRYVPENPNRTHGALAPSLRVSHDTATPKLVEKQIPQAKAPVGRNYEFFSGNTIFCLGGRLQNTRHRPVNIITAFVIVLPAVLFFAFSAPWLWQHVSPALPVVFAYLVFVCLSSFFHASVADPGILPRNLHPQPPPDTDDPLAIGPSLSDWTMVKSTNPNMTAMDVPTKYCKTCSIWRPLRAHHCRLCDNCIETLDHHCVWLNNCIGRRNYRYFLAFISSAVVLGLFLSLASLGHCIAVSNRNAISFRSAIEENRIPFAMFLYGLLGIPYPISLLGYHLFLTGRAETTREYLNSHKFLPKDRHRPFEQYSIFANWKAIILRPLTPSYLQFNIQHMEGDPRFGTQRGFGMKESSGYRKEGEMEMQNVPSQFSSHIPYRGITETRQ